MSRSFLARALPIVVGATFSYGMSAAMAELYVSPVLRDTVTFNQEESTGKAVESSDSESFVVSGKSTVHGDFVMRSSEQSLRFGDNVPLFIAMEHVVPNAKDWSIKIDEGLPNQAISWKGGKTWEGTLKLIEQENNLSIAINHNEKAIGVGLSPDIAIALASREQHLWRLDSKQALRENLESWAKQSDWSMHWDESIASVNYPVVSDTAIKGKLHGKGGVIDRILNATQKRAFPIAADFYYGNKLIHVRPAGYEHEVKY